MLMLETFKSFAKFLQGFATFYFILHVQAALLQLDLEEVGQQESFRRTAGCWIPSVSLRA